MDQHDEHCPTCGRAFARVVDYPLVRVLSFGRLPLPEAVDDLSAAAWEQQRARNRNESPGRHVSWTGGINMTPAIDKACDTADVRDYFSYLEALSGQVVTPDNLVPSWPADGRFRTAWPVSGTDIYLSIENALTDVAGERLALIQAYCPGPNLGSAGGPTLQQLGPVAQIRYRGLLRESSG